MADDLREQIAAAITYHPANRTGTPEQRHPVSLMLANAIIPVLETAAVAPWTSRCVECCEQIENGDRITWRMRWSPPGPIHEECR